MAKPESVTSEVSTPSNLGGYVGSCSGFLNPLEASHLNRPIAMESASFSMVRSTFQGETGKGVGEDMDTGLLADCAAVVIQCKVRKHLAIKEAHRRRAHKSKKGDTEVAESIAVAIPTEFQGLHGVSFDADAKKKKKKAHKMPQTAADIYAAESSEEDEEDEEVKYGLIEDMAALTIQTKQRQAQAKHRVDDLKKKRRADFDREIEASLEQTAALTLQSAQRRHAAQQEVKKLRTDVTPAAPKSSPPREKFSKKTKTTTGSSSSLPSRSGAALNSVFYSSSSLLLDRSSTMKVSALWGVRILHTVTMDLKKEGQGDVLPQLEATNWVQGTLESILTESRGLTKSPEPSAVNRPGSANRLAPLEGAKSPGVRPGSGNTKLAPLNK